jgi:ferritin-like metal-binding protein YciE
MAMADKTISSAELLELCLWDIHAGCRDSAERLPQIVIYATDARLRTKLGACIYGANSRAQNISNVAKSPGGPENLWMAGILNDAQRDTRSIKEGQLLDIALIGAIRKALASEQASTKTALALSLSLNEQSTFFELSKNAWNLRDLDAQLHISLTDLA